jgi:hypothetical protein
MNVRAKCVNKQCPEYGVVKSVMLEKYAGQGAPNERIICRTCGQLMRTTKTVDVTAKIRTKPFKVAHGNSSNRKVGRKKPAGHKKPTVRKSSPGKKKI